MALITNLIRYFKFDENAANTSVVDATGIGNATSSTNTSNLYDSSGVLNSAFTLVSANSEYVDSNFQIADASSDKTINYWFKSTSTALMKPFGAYDGSDYWYMPWMNVVSTNRMYYMGQAGAKIGVYSTDSTPFDGDWHMLTFVQSGATQADLAIYVDGYAISTTVYSSGTISANAIGVDMYIGANNPNGAADSFVNGNMDEFGYWDRELSAAEILSLWNNGDGLAYPFTAPEVGVSLQFQTDGLNYVAQPI